MPRTVNFAASCRSAPSRSRPAPNSLARRVASRSAASTPRYGRALVVSAKAMGPILTPEHAGLQYQETGVLRISGQVCDDGQRANQARRAHDERSTDSPVGARSDAAG